VKEIVEHKVKEEKRSHTGMGGGMKNHFNFSDSPIGSSDEEK
jgi:hypothetical protein